ncbi:MAG: hypothetical protein AB8G16_06240 [Gammaproteobacteria bacterium]
MFLKPTMRCAVIAATALVAVPAFGVEYLITPRLDQRLEFDNNLQLNNDPDTIEAVMYQITAAAEMRARGDVWGFSGDALLQASRFDADSFNSDNQEGNFSIMRFGERSVLQIDMGVSRNAQRTAELDGSGLLGLEATRVERVTARPVASFQLSELYRLTVGGTLTNQTFEADVFEDFRNIGFDIALARQFSERTSADITLFGSDYVTDEEASGGCSPTLTFFNGQLIQAQRCNLFDTNRESRTYGLQLGVQRALSDTFSWGISLGGREVESQSRQSNILVGCLFSADLSTLLDACTPLATASIEDTSSGLIASTNLSYSSKRFSYNVGFQRSVSPVSLGFLIESDRLNAGANYRLTEKLTAISNISYQTSDSATSAVEFERTFVSVDASLDWRVTESWRVAPGIRWREQETTFASMPTDSISVFVKINYRPDRIQFSR